MQALGTLRANDIDNKNAQNKNNIPPELERQFTVIITPGENAKPAISKMREIKANSIGSLVTIKGIVTRASDVKPQMQVAVYTCEACGMEVYQVVHNKEFTPTVECPSAKCVKNNIKGQLHLQIKQSKFVAYQDIKIQEPSDQVPIGHVPRSLDLIAKGPMTRQCSPGDIVSVTGIYMPAKPDKYNPLRSHLTHHTHVEVFQIVKQKINFREHMLSDQMVQKVDDLKNSMSESDLFKRMADSICPEIFGMEEVK